MLVPRRPTRHRPVQILQEVGSRVQDDLSWREAGEGAGARARRRRGTTTTGRVGLYRDRNEIPPGRCPPQRAAVLPDAGVERWRLHGDNEETQTTDRINRFSPSLPPFRPAEDSTPKLSEEEGGWQPQSTQRTNDSFVAKLIRYTRYIHDIYTGTRDSANERTSSQIHKPTVKIHRCVLPAGGSVPPRFPLILTVWPFGRLYGSGFSQCG